MVYLALICCPQSIFQTLRCGTSISRVAVRCATGTVVLILRLNTVIPCPAGASIYGDKDRHLPCASAALWLDQVPDIILFRDCTLLSFSHSPIVVLDKTVSIFIYHRDAEHRISMSPQDVQPGTVVHIFRLNTVFHVPH